MLQAITKCVLSCFSFAINLSSIPILQYMINLHLEIALTTADELLYNVILVLHKYLPGLKKSAKSQVLFVQPPHKHVLKG